MKIKQYKDYKEVPKKYKWDLSFLLEGKTPQKLMEEIIGEQRKLIDIKDSKYSSSKEYLKYLKNEEKLGIKFNKFLNYISNSQSQNVVDPVPRQLMQKFQFEIFNISKELGSEKNRFYKHASKISKWIKEPGFKEFRHDIQSSLDEKKYKLSDAIEEFLIKTQRGSSNFNEPFSLITNSELEFKDATTSTGKKIKLNQANKSQLAKHNDKIVRKTSSIEYRNAYLKHKESLSNLLYQNFKDLSSKAEVRKYKSTVEMLTFDDRVSDKFLQTLYSAVSSNKGIKGKYRNLYKKFYKARFKEAATKYDFSRDLAQVKTEYTPDEACKIVLAAVKPFGKEYYDVVSNGFKNNWVDMMPVKNKRGGAYSIGGTRGVEKKLILMNFDGTYNSVATLAHEFGHSMHSYFSDKVQKYPNSSYPIFLAEIASIFNELMLSDYMIKNSKNDKLKFNILNEQITSFFGTVFRQVEWSNYEYDLYKAVDAGQPVGTYEAISRIYYENSQKYSDKKKKYKAEEQYPSFYVPHFYYGFYVYKYAIGQLVAQIFFAKYKKEGVAALENFIDKFLSAGGHDHPINILKKAGVDLEDPEVYNLGFESLKESIKEYEKIGKKIFKIK